tara:strand:- start:104 stop:700 length:597 start_codon:yes stop_codon:yes gene_type:complete
MLADSNHLHLINELQIFQKFFSKPSVITQQCFENGVIKTNSCDYILSSAISQIISHGINGVLPNWLALRKELFNKKTKKLKKINHPSVNLFNFSPQLIFQVIVRDKTTQNELFEKYKIVFVPGFDNYIVTLQSKNLSRNYFKDFAIGKADGSLSPKRAAKEIINEFNKTCEKFNVKKKILLLLDSGIMYPEELHECFV